MNVQRSFLLLGFLSLLYVSPSLSLQLATAQKYLTQAQQLVKDNKKTCKNGAKALAALWLLKGTANVFSLYMNMNPADATKVPISSIIYTTLLHPVAYTTEDSYSRTYNLKEISAPPYITSFAIAAYLLGHKDIYAKVGTWMKDRLAITNKHALNITKHMAKIGGGFLLAKGYYHMFNDYFTTIRPNSDQPLSVTKFFKYLWSPKAMIVDDKNVFVEKASITHPPYIPAVGISAYLLGTGSYGIYKEVKAWIEESKNQAIV